MERVRVKGQRHSALTSNHQTKWHHGPGCRFGDQCNYSHDECKSKGEYEALVKRIADARENSGSDSSDGGVRAGQRKALREFQTKFCSYGNACKFKDTTCKKDHSKTPEEWKQGKERLLASLSKTSGGSTPPG